MPSIVQVQDLRKRYGDIEAVRGISFSVEQGEVFGMLGPNGAGKTTTVEILEGLRRADGGSATVAGVDVLADPSGVKRRIGVHQLSSAHCDDKKQQRSFHTLRINIPRLDSFARRRVRVSRTEAKDCLIQGR